LTLICAKGRIAGAKRFTCAKCLKHGYNLDRIKSRPP
jgi:hypothetical protein